MADISYQANLVRFVYDSGSIITAQRRHRREFSKTPPHKNLIIKWFKQFNEIGNIKKENDQKGLRNLTSADDVRAAMLLSRHATVRRFSLQSPIPMPTVRGILHQRLEFRS